METYQTKDVARMLGVADSTVRRWALDYEQYLSPSAQIKGATGRARRAFTDRDLQIFWTIHTLTDRGKTHKEIDGIIAAGDLEQSLPPDLPQSERYPVDMMPVSTAEERYRALQIRVSDLQLELESERALSADRAGKIADLERELGTAKAEIARLEGRASVARLEGQQDKEQELQQTREQLGELRGRLHQLEAARPYRVQSVLWALLAVAVVLAGIVAILLISGAAG